jgi:hypothetical protein
MKMNKKSQKLSSPKWLTEELQFKVRSVFEPKYNRPLSDNEVITIAENLADFMDHFFKFKWRLDYANQTK